MPFDSNWRPTNWPAAYPFCDMSVTPKGEPYCVAPARFSATPLIGNVLAPTALVDAGMFSATGPTGDVGVPPLEGNTICVEAAGLPLASVASGVPLAVTYTFHVSVDAF